jgi:hypothetical protein
MRIEKIEGKGMVSKGGVRDVLPWAHRREIFRVFFHSPPQEHSKEHAQPYETREYGNKNKEEISLLHACELCHAEEAGCSDEKRNSPRNVDFDSLRNGLKRGKEENKSDEKTERRMKIEMSIKGKRGGKLLSRWKQLV